MTFKVYQHWDPLRECVVGRCYPPEFFSWIKNYPGSLVHYWFAVDHVFPVLDKMFSLAPEQDLLYEATKFDKLAHI